VNAPVRDVREVGTSCSGLSAGWPNRPMQARHAVMADRRAARDEPEICREAGVQRIHCLIDCVVAGRLGVRLIQNGIRGKELGDGRAPTLSIPLTEYAHQVGLQELRIGIGRLGGSCHGHSLGSLDCGVRSVAFRLELY
jgi:hypothetical protein